jgi:hypothetical protein
MTERDILLDLGTYWVGRTKGSYTVYRTGLTHSTPDSSYAPDADGLSIAIARAEYLARKHRSPLN